MDAVFSTKDLAFMDSIFYSDMEIERGRTAFISGKSGCGKTTLLRLFNHTVNPSRGKIYFENKDIRDCNFLELRKKALLVSQSVYLFQGTIKDNFKQYYEYRGMEVIDDEKINEYLRLCAIEFDVNTKCDTMSGGERQRVFIAICLSFKPSVLMLDEPTSALDERTGEMLLSNLKSYASENAMTLIIVCHQGTLVDKFADSVITLRGSGENE